MSLDAGHPLPPLNEQRRIVAAIEEHLSRLDAADASLAAAAARLEAPAERSLAQRSSAWNGAPTRPIAELARLRRTAITDPPKRVAIWRPYLRGDERQAWRRLTVDGAMLASPEWIRRRRAKGYEPAREAIVIARRALGRSGESAVVPAGLAV